MDNLADMPRSRFVIEGGNPISGALQARGNKNAALPMLAAALLTDDEVTLSNVPRIRDVEAQIGLLRQLGADAEIVGDDTVRIRASGLGDEDPDPELCRAIRASILLAGPLLARRGRV
ncbi:MAG: UDP-N-acetylglucosamine 1-carboxyvinyltransferase, partial [Acidobacteria bacterium]|nr:UDP-N-acetylglucosamine 1-carboxyvinyltransferase [Acidobacteriota bacterium]